MNKEIPRKSYNEIAEEFKISLMEQNRNAEVRVYRRIAFFEMMMCVGNLIVMCCLYLINRMSSSYLWLLYTSVYIGILGVNHYIAAWCIKKKSNYKGVSDSTGILLKIYLASTTISIIINIISIISGTFFRSMFGFFVSVYLTIVTIGIFFINKKEENRNA